MGHLSLLLRGKRITKELYIVVNTVLSSKKGRYILIGITLFISIVILGYLIYSQRGSLLDFDWQLNYFFLIPFFIFYLINLVLVTFVWKEILKVFTIYEKFWHHLSSYAIANLAKRIPGTIWYIPIRSQIYNKNIRLTPKIAVLASGIELLLLAISSFLVVIAFSINNLAIKIPHFFWILILTLILLVVILNPKVNKIIFGFFSQSEVKLRWQQFLQWILIYILTRIFGGSMLYCVVALFGFTPISNLPTIIEYHSFVALISLVVFILPTNMGLTEVGISLLLSSIMPSSIAVLVALSNRILVLAMDIITGGTLGLLLFDSSSKLTNKDY